MTVLGVRVRVLPTANDVVVLLKEEQGARALPILIGPHEGVAIASAQSGVNSGRPGPYDLLLTSLSAAGASIESVEIVALQDGIFMAELVLSNGERVDSRTSDAIALALRADAPVFCAADIVDAAGLHIDSESDDEELYLSRDDDTETEVAQFRSFLDEVDPEDFRAAEE